MENFISTEMQNRYFQRRQNDLNELMQANSNGSYDDFFLIGHRMKGNAATFGFDELADLGQDMCMAADLKDSILAKSCVERFDRWLKEHDQIH